MQTLFISIASVVTSIIVVALFTTLIRRRHKVDPTTLFLLDEVDPNCQHEWKYSHKDHNFGVTYYKCRKCPCTGYNF